MRALAFATIVMSGVPLAAAETGGVIVACLSPRIVVIGGVPERWQAPLAEACAGMQGLADIDQSASVVVSGDDTGLTVDVTTTDGREAVRRARDPLTLRNTLEALLTVPVQPWHPSAIVADPKAAPSPLPAPEPLASPQPAPPPSPTAHEVVPEIGIAVSGRIATHGREMLGPALFGAVHINDWLLGGSLRWDALENRGPNTAPHYEANAIAAGITLGRRVSHGLVDCDLAFEPRLIAESQSYHKVDHESGSTTADFWFAGLVRTAFGHSPARPYVQADIEVAPSRLRRTFVNDPSDDTFKPLPSWSIGVAIGVAVGAQ